MAALKTRLETTHDHVKEGEQILGCEMERMLIDERKVG